MDWSSDLKRLYIARQTINSESATQADKNRAKKEEKELLSKAELFDFDGDKTVDIDDLIRLSSVDKDVDDDSKVSDEEKTFFDDVKNIFYDVLAKGINRNKDLKVDDLLNLEEKIRGLDEAQQNNVGAELSKLQNRMVSNLTSQFFVNKETAAYKEKATADMIELMNAKVDLTNMSKNNPFGETKTADLLDKLENRVTRTLSQDYTMESIAEFKTTQNEAVLVERTDKDDDKEDKPVDTSNLKFVDGVLYNGEEKYSGLYNNICYENGTLCKGVSSVTGKYYEKGIPADGVFDNVVGTTVTGKFFVENGTIKYEDKYEDAYKNNTVRCYFESYKHKENGVNVPSVISKVITFTGLVETGKPDNTGKIELQENYENGKKVSTSYYAYNEDGSYMVKTVFVDKSKKDEIKKFLADGKPFDGKNGAFNGKLYVNGELAQGVVDGKYYVDGELHKGNIKKDGVLYVKGEKLTGIYSEDGKYYEDGKIKVEATDKDGKKYFNGILADGIYTRLEDGEEVNEYYNDGKKEDDKEKEDVVKFATSIFAYSLRDIENVQKAQDGTLSFKASQFINNEFRNVEYTVTDSKNFTISFELDEDVKQIDIIEGGVLKDTKIQLGTQTIEIDHDGAKDYKAIDYSVRTINADGKILGVEISDAISDGITRVRVYKKSDDGSYKPEKEQIVFGSISDMQSGKIIGAYTIEPGIISYKIEDDKVKITDESLTGVTIEKEFALNNSEETKEGEFVGGTITFNNPDASVTEPTITLGEKDACVIKDGKVIVKKYNAEEVKYVVTTYETNGKPVGDSTEIDDKDGQVTNFAKKLGLNMENISDVEFTDGKISKCNINGVEYNVSETGDTVTIKTEDDSIEKRYKNSVVIYDKLVKLGNTVISEYFDNGNKKSDKIISATESYEAKYDEITKVCIESKNSKIQDGKLKETMSTFDIQGKTTSVKVVEYKGDTIESGISKETTYNGEVSDAKKLSEKTYTDTNVILTNFENGKTVDKTTYNIVDGKEVLSEILKYDTNVEDRIVEKTTVSGTEKTVEKYTYSSVVVGNIISTVKEIYENDVIQKIEELGSDGICSKETKFENGFKSEVLTYNERFENGNPKKVTIEEYRGDVLVRVKVRTYNVDGSYVDKVEDEVVDGVDKDGDEITVQQMNFAQIVGLNITDVVYNEDGSLNKIIGTRYGDRISHYTNWSVNESGQYSYIEEITLAENSAGTADDVILRTNVENNQQKNAKVFVDGTGYSVNVNGAITNDNIDNSIVTYMQDETAGKIIVADVLVDGIVRQRQFSKKSDSGYDLTTLVALGSIADTQNATKNATVPKFIVANDETLDDNSITVVKNGNKIPVYLGDSTPAYNIELKEGETFTIDKNGVVTSQYKSVTKTITTTYTFTADGGYIKSFENDGVEINITYDKDGATIKALNIGDKEIDLDSATLSDGGKTISVTVAAKEDPNAKIGYQDLVYSLVKTDNNNVGDILRGKIKFNNNAEYVLKENDSVVLGENNKTVTITTKVPDTDLTEVITYTPECKITAIKLNDVQISLEEFDNIADSCSIETDKFVIAKSYNEGKIEVRYNYAISDNEEQGIEIGDKLGGAITFTNDTSEKVITFGKDDVVTYNNGKLTISSNGIDTVYDSTGNVVEYKIGDTVLNATGVTKTVSADGKTITFARSGQSGKIDYEFSYNVETETLSGKLKNGTDDVTLNNIGVIDETLNDYIAINANGKCLIYSKTLDNWNETRNLSFEDYKAFIQIMNEYNSKVTSDISLRNIKEVDFDNDDNDIVKFGLESGYDGVTSAVKYDRNFKTFVREFTIGEQKIVAPLNTTISKATSGVITVTYSYTESGTAKTTTIVLSKVKAEGEEADPEYYNKVSKDGATAVDINENAQIRILNDGTIED